MFKRYKTKQPNIRAIQFVNEKIDDPIILNKIRRLVYSIDPCAAVYVVEFSSDFRDHELNIELSNEKFLYAETFQKNKLVITAYNYLAITDDNKFLRISKSLLEEAYQEVN